MTQIHEDLRTGVDCKIQIRCTNQVYIYCIVLNKPISKIIFYLVNCWPRDSLEALPVVHTRLIKPVLDECRIRTAHAMMHQNDNKGCLIHTYIHWKYSVLIHF